MTFVWKPDEEILFLAEGGFAETVQRKQRVMTDLIDTTEMYLRTILELEEDGITPRRARISHMLGHSGPTVSETIARMEKNALVSLLQNRHLCLSEEGRLKAVRVMRKHRLVERFLFDIVGLEWEFVHEEACRWEHVISQRVEQKLLAMLPGVRVSPYGNVIPGLDELGVVEQEHAVTVGQSLYDLVKDSGSGKATIIRFGEFVQSDHNCLVRLRECSMMPNEQVRFCAAEQEDVCAALECDLGAVFFSEESAKHVFLLPVK